MIGLTLSINNAIAEGRDPGGIASDAVGSRILSSYSGSYALLIGESQYTNGWSNLESIPGELREVEKILQSQGFKVEKSFNLNAEDLTKRFKRFINKYGFEENNRLLFFYSGHGYTRKAKGTHKGKGYIVPVDAANPNFDETAFLRKAVGMDQILTWARKIEAKHVLFLFDSCFSGTVFKARDLPKVPRQIGQAAEKPVRQFITAGSADERVPAESVFAPAFVDALRYGWGDLYKDGYVTGEELGLYLKNKVPQHTEQTPQYGKIRDYELSRGDFVFVVGSGSKPTMQSYTPASVPVFKPPASRLKSNSDGDNYDVITRSDIEPVFNGFIAAWNNRQYGSTISYLSPNFVYVDQEKVRDYYQYIAKKKQLYRKYNWISVNVSNVRYSFNGNKGTVTYYQHFNSPSYESKGTNKFYFKKNGGQTKIIKEEFERDWYRIK
jgi:hypothetical protein